MPNFTHNFVTNRLDRWLPHVQDMVGKPIHALEIGSHEGRGTLWMLEHILTHRAADIVCLDPFCPNESFGFVEPYADTFRSNTEPYRGKIKVIAEMSQHAYPYLASLGVKKFDLVYVDGSHEPLDVIDDAALAWRFTGERSVIVFDDYAWDAVRRPVDAFLALFDGTWSAVELDSQLLVRRLA